MAEQIGAQIFIDGWAIVAPGDPELAARLAEQAARVSHDGAAVDAAKLWAAMEAEAFVSRDIDHLLDVGLAQIAAGEPDRPADRRRSPLAPAISGLARHAQPRSRRTTATTNIPAIATSFPITRS